MTIKKSRTKKKSSRKATAKSKAKTTTKKTKKKTTTKTASKKRVKKVTGKDGEKYEFTNYYTSEPKLSTLTHKSPIEEIFSAFSNIIKMQAAGHVRTKDGVDLEDLISEGKTGVMKAIYNYERKKKKYTFVQYCLYEIRAAISQYCLGNASPIKTPYYIQRGCMHVGQIFMLMQNQSVAEHLLNRRGPASEQEIIDFIYNPDERLPKKKKTYIKAQINKKLSKEEQDQVYRGVMNHEQGSRHSFVKKNLSDPGKILHIKQKIWYTATSNNMQYERVIELVMLARRTRADLDPMMLGQSVGKTENKVLTKQLFERGAQICGDDNFKIFLENKFYDNSYDAISTKYGIKKNTVTDIVKRCIRLLRKDEVFIKMFEEM